MARHEISENSKIKIPPKITSGTDSKGIPYWKFGVALTEEVNDETLTFDMVWLKIIGKPFSGWLKINRINKITFSRVRNEKGGFNIYKTLVVDVEKLGDNL